MAARTERMIFVVQGSDVDVDVDPSRPTGEDIRAALGDADAMLRKARIIDEALSARSVSACAVAVLDARHGVDARSVGLRIGPGALHGTAGPASAVVSGIAGIREATALLIGRHC